MPSPAAVPESPPRPPAAPGVATAHAPAARGAPARLDAPRARALGTAVAYGRVARATRASPHTLAQLVRTVPAPDEAARRANVWAALGAYFGWDARTGAARAAAAPDYEV